MNFIELNISNTDGSLIGRLDLGEAELNIVYQLADVKDPTKKSGDFTYPFSIPGTKNNNIIFSSIYEEGFSQFRYNPNKKLNAQIILNGNELFIGDLQLNSINKTDDKIIGYEITIYGKIPSFIEDLSNLKINELVDLSDYNHPYTRQNVVNSWNTSIIQYGTPKTFSLGEGYVYPMEWRGQNYPLYWKVEDFKPAIYVKTIFDRILQNKGWSYQSNFLNSDYFKKLIIPYNGDDTIELTDTEVRNYEAWSKYNAPPNRPLLASYGSATGQNFTDIPIVFPDDTNNPAFDDGGNYNPSTGVMTIPKNGKWTLSATIRLTCEFTGASIPPGTTYSQIKLRGGLPEGTLKLKNLNTGQVVAQTAFSFTSQDFLGQAANTPVVSDIQTPNVSFTGYLAAGTKFGVFFQYRTTGSNYTYKTDVNIGAGVYQNKNTNTDIRLQVVPLGTSYNPFDAPRFILTLVDRTLALGDTMNLNSFIPDMKADEFINEITRLFNLYWKKSADKTFIIEPRNDFYGTLPIVDWTYKVNNLEPIKIEPLYDLVAKNWKFTYTEDGDYYNEDYVNNFNEIYGTKEIVVDNDFVNENEELQSKFSPTPSVKYLNTDRVLPTYVEDNGGTLQSFKPKLRILFYGGFISTLNPWNFIDPYTNIVILPNFTKYPYAGHFDNPTLPSYDLNFGTTKKYYFNWNNIPNSNLFNLFWRNYVEEITDKNSHLLTLRLFLNDYDIINFDLRSVIQINEVYYRVNKLQHNPLTSECEVELFKVKDYMVPYTSYMTPEVISGSVSNLNSPQIIVVGGNLPTNTTRSAQTQFGSPTPQITTRPFVSTGSALRKATFVPITGATDIVWTSADGSRSENPLVFGGRSFGEQPPIRRFYEQQNNDLNRNLFSPQAAQKVLGRDNIIDPSAYGIDIVGNGNSVASGTENIIINGNRNIIAAGLSNITVIGDDQIITKSNFSYIRGVALEAGSVGKKVDILKSPTNKVGFDIKVVAGGKNSVRADKVIRG